MKATGEQQGDGWINFYKERTAKLRITEWEQWAYSNLRLALWVECVGGKAAWERVSLGNYTNCTDVKTLLRIALSCKEKGTKEVSAFCCEKNGLVRAHTHTRDLLYYPYDHVPLICFIINGNTLKSNLKWLTPLTPHKQSKGYSPYNPVGQIKRIACMIIR